MSNVETVQAPKVALQLGGHMLPRALEYKGQEFEYYAGQAGLDTTALPETFAGSMVEIDSPNGVAYIYPAIEEGEAICPILQIEESCVAELNESENTVTCVWQEGVILPLQPALDAFRGHLDNTASEVMNRMMSGYKDYQVAMLRDMEQEASAVMDHRNNNMITEPLSDFTAVAPMLTGICKRNGDDVSMMASGLLAGDRERRRKMGLIVGDVDRAHAILNDIEAAGEGADYATLITELWDDWMSEETVKSLK